VLRDRGHLTLILIGQNKDMFNALYKVLGTIAPGLLGETGGAAGAGADPVDAFRKF
jgi:hypothetical protein